MDIYNHFVKCVHQAKYLKSKGFDLSQFMLEQTLKEDPRVYAEKHYKYSTQFNDGTHLKIWDCILMNLIGEYPNLRILDIGCGKGTLSKAMAKNNSVTITTIDHKTIPIIKDAYSHTHYNAKWDSKAIEKLEKNYYDIIICDVEPHGNETLIYNHYLPFLKDIHIYLNPCFGVWGFYLSSVFNTFVETFKTHIIDKYACNPPVNYYGRHHKYRLFYDLFCTNIVWLIMSKSSVQPINTISDYLFLSEGNGDKYIDTYDKNETFGKNSKRMKLFVDDLSCLEN